MAYVGMCTCLNCTVLYVVCVAMRARTSEPVGLKLTTTSQEHVCKEKVGGKFTGLVFHSRDPFLVNATFGKELFLSQRSVDEKRALRMEETGGQSFPQRFLCTHVLDKLRPASS